MDYKNTALKILNTLSRNGFAAYLVGGCVRDMCMALTPYDYDITTSALPAEVKAIFEKTADTGLKHGTVTVIEDQIPFEVTTFRTESTYKNHRKPDKVSFVTDIREDLKRRDFTINAMAYHPEKGILDPYGGQEDIQSKCIRCVGNPYERFEEDALRILRGVRFACKTGFSIHPITFAAMQEKRWLLKHISVERIYAELTKSLCSAYPEKLRLAYEAGIFEVILPALHLCFQTTQNTKYHVYNVGDHILKTVCNCPPDKTVRFAALLHDIAKPQCKTTDTNGQDHFKGHESKSALLAADILRRLKSEKALITDVSILIANHRAQDYPDKLAVKRKMLAVDKARFPAFLALLKADTAAHNPAYNAPRLAAQQVLTQCYAEILKNNEPLEIKDLAISGNDLISAGYQNTEIGQKLNELLDFVLRHPEQNTKQALTERIKR